MVTRSWSDLLSYREINWYSVPQGMDGIFSKQAESKFSAS